MIETIGYEKSTLDLRQLNLISGFNGTGKSRLMGEIAAEAQTVQRVYYLGVQRQFCHFDPSAPLGCERMAHPDARGAGFAESYALYMGEIFPYRETAAAQFANPPVVRMLRAQPGNALFVEKPELGLHPDSQSALGRMLVKAAVAGVQVFLETDSSHILNAVRVSVHGGILPPEDVKIYWIDPEAGIMSPRCDRNGRIDRWPTGFFDREDQDLYLILEPAKRKNV